MFIRGRARLEAGLVLVVLSMAVGFGAMPAPSKPPLRDNEQTRSDAIALPPSLEHKVRHALKTDAFDLQSVRPVVHPDGGASVELAIDGVESSLQVRVHSLRAASFTLTASDANRRTQLVPPPSHTYQGSIDGTPDSIAALSIRDGQVTGLFDDGDRVRWIQPASALVPDAPADAHIIVRQVDLPPLDGDLPTCGVDALGFMPAPQPLASSARLAGAGVCLSETEIAFDCDYEFWELEGFSEEELTADVEAIVNAMDAIYRRDTGITYRITGINYWTDPDDDPYTATNHSQMLGELKNWWNTNETGVQRDVAHLMTGKEIDGSVIGVAFLGVICDLEDAYGLSQSLWTEDFARRVVLTAHELGHNWNACHCNQTGCTGGAADPDCAIMCSSVSGCTQTHDRFNQRTIDAITGWRDSIDCLSAAESVSVAIARLPAATPGMGDGVGQSVAVSGEWAIVGAPGDDTAMSDAGAAYIFQQQAGAWVQVQKLTAPDAAIADVFGYAVDIDGTNLIIGAPLKNRTSPNLADVGAAYIFRLADTTWVFDEKLEPNDPNASDQFGTSVAIRGQRAVVGSYLDDDHGNGSGSAYVFDTNGVNWFLEDKLVPADGEPNDQFGIAVDLDGDHLVVGAWRADAPAFDSGAAYIFQFDGVEWIEQDKLLSPDAGIVDQFGRAVAMSGGAVIIGAPGDDEAGSEWGAAYGYSNSGSTWDLDGKLMPSLVSDIGQFGVSVAMAQDLALIGAWRDDLAGADAGSAFLFQRQLNWVEQSKFAAPVLEDLERFGTSVALGDGVVVIGASLTDADDVDSGSAYASAVQISTEDCNENGTADGCEITLGFASDVNGNGIPDECECLSDIDLDGQVAVQDLLSVLGNWGVCEGPCPPLCEGDIDGNCNVDVTDLLEVLGNWGPCPNQDPPPP